MSSSIRLRASEEKQGDGAPVAASGHAHYAVLPSGQSAAIDRENVLLHAWKTLERLSRPTLWTALLCIRSNGYIVLAWMGDGKRRGVPVLAASRPRVVPFMHATASSIKYSCVRTQRDCDCFSSKSRASSSRSSSQVGFVTGLGFEVGASSVRACWVPKTKMSWDNLPLCPT
jgi:hypothetical protein